MQVIDELGASAPTARGKPAADRQAALAHHPAALSASLCSDAGGEDAQVLPFRANKAESRAGADEEGSLVTEYGLLAVVAATIAGVVIQWASGGAIVRLFNALLNAARDLVGAG